MQFEPVFNRSQEQQELQGPLLGFAFNYMLTLPISTQHMWWWSQPSLELCRVPKMILQISVIVQARGLLRHRICVNYTVSCIRDGAEVCSPRRSCLWKALCLPYRPWGTYLRQWWAQRYLWTLALQKISQFNRLMWFTVSPYAQSAVKI